MKAEGTRVRHQPRLRLTPDSSGSSSIPRITEPCPAHTLPVTPRCSGSRLPGQHRQNLLCPTRVRDGSNWRAAGLSRLPGSHSGPGQHVGPAWRSGKRHRAEGPGRAQPQQRGSKAGPGPVTEERGPGPSEGRYSPHPLCGCPRCGLPARSAPAALGPPGRTRHGAGAGG